MTLPMDPSEVPGTPEYEELTEYRKAYRQMVEEVMTEHKAYEAMQWPYRFSH